MMAFLFIASSLSAKLFPRAGSFNATAGIRHAPRLKENGTHHSQPRGGISHNGRPIIRTKIEQIACHGHFTMPIDSDQRSACDGMVKYASVFTRQLRY
jgi:hypothetical protein